MLNNDPILPSEARQAAPAHLPKAREKASERLRQTAAERDELLRPVLEGLALAGIDGPRPIANRLNELGLPARRGGPWTPGAVARILERVNRTA